ncbi:MAG: hypothetical protein PF448_06410 [Bacteroidales bacterium]|jgi:hypothetical protein|nr:hypothetical protein [Bacteroidales bacterium]
MQIGMIFSGTYFTGRVEILGIDEVVYFDAGTWEFPEMKFHLNKVEKYTGLEITRLLV